MAEARRIPVLMYHRVGPREGRDDRHAVTPQRFERHMAVLATQGMHACKVDDFIGWLDGTCKLPAGSFLLTFDDGYQGIHTHAAAVLARYGWPATVFLVSGLIGGKDAWRGRDNPVARDYPLLNTDQIQQLAELDFTFHSHSRRHWDLTALNDADLADEVAGSRAELSALLGGAPRYLAYPYGRFDARVDAAARAAGYSAAFSVQSGFNRPGQDRFSLRRLDVFGSDNPAMLLRKVRYGSNDGTLIQPIRYYLGRIAARLGLKQ